MGKPEQRINKEAADEAVFFIEHLNHTKGRWYGTPFKLASWQKDEIIRPPLGTLKSDGTRQYRTAYIEIPRKNGKSTLAAAIALYLLLTLEEPTGLEPSLAHSLRSRTNNSYLATLAQVVGC